MLKVIKTLFEIVRKLFTIFLIVFLAIIVTQRLTDNKNSIAGVRVFTVITPSMEPEYKVGDAILTKTIDPSKIKIGDDITYIGTEESFKDKIVTHRVISTEKNNNGIYIFQTKGIANDKADPKINETQVYGKVLYKIKSISYLNGVIGNLYGMYFAIVVPLGVMMVIEFVLYSKDREDDDEDEEEDDREDEEKQNNKEDKNDNKNIEKNRTIINEEKNIVKDKKNKKNKDILEKEDEKYDEDDDEDEDEYEINKKAIEKAKSKIDKLDKKREKRKTRRNKRREKRRRKNSF